MSETHASDSQAGRVRATQRVADLNEAVTAYARGDVLYGIGDTLPPVFGGVQRLTGIRSEIILQPIVALQGRVMNHFYPAAV